MTTISPPPLAHRDGLTDTWRDTLFVWSGDVETTTRKNASSSSSSDDDDESFTWTGKWVGVNSGEQDAPTEEDVLDSVNAFAVVGKLKRDDGTGFIQFVSTEYLLDNGDGLETHEDPKYEAVWIEIEDGTKIVAASGSNEFGGFVSVGHWKKNKLTLARRYVEKGDCRTFMAPEDVIEDVAMSHKDLDAAMPWRDRVCRCSFYKASEEQREAFKERSRQKCTKRKK